MSLKKRLILILLASGFILALLVHFSINTTIIPDLKQQKNILIDKLKKMLQASVTSEEKSITALCDSWAGWDAMIDYTANQSAGFEKEFLSDSSFLSHMLNLILVLDPGEKILYNKNYRNDVKFITFDRLKIEKAVDKIKKIVKKTQHPFKGIINSEYGPLMIVANPVNVGETSKGLLMLGRFIDKKRIKKISFHFTGTIQLVSFKEKQLFAFYLKQLQGKNPHYWEDKEKMTLLYLVKDIYDRPSIILKTESGNKIFRLIKKHTLLYIIFTVLSIAFLGILVYVLIEKYMSKRIIRISSDMKKIQGLRDVSMRISQDSKGDEISSLILNLNNMLDSIEKEKQNRETIEQMLITREKLVSIGRLSASIAHEIHNPILAISNCIDALKETCKTHPGASDLDKQAIAISETEIARIRNIISNLLDFHRLDNKEFSEVNLDEVVLQSLEVLKWSKKLDSIKIIIKKQRSFFIFGSHGKLKQVFINFILNAAEANAGNKGELRLEILLSDDKKFCEIHFIDNGPGILPGIKNKLFEPFVSTKQDKGVGLGLYISYKIIKNHHGEIVYDDSYKEGAYFIIKLPVIERQK